MPKCTICAHLDRDTIDHELLSGKSFRFVAVRFGVSPTALYRHKQAHIAADLARLPALEDRARSDGLLAMVEAQQAAAAARSLDLLQELQNTLARVRKLSDACDDWLTDPDDPDRYDLGPRAGEVLVHYTALGPRGAPVARKAPLSELLARAFPRQAPPPAPETPDKDAAAPRRARRQRGEILSVDRVELRHADPRELILKAAHRLEAELHLVARLVGQLQEPAPVQTVNILVASPAWIATRTALLDALAPYPEARAAVVAALQNVVGEPDAC